MPVVPDPAAFQERLRGLPVMRCAAGETVLSAGSTDGRLLVLRSGAVEVLKDGVRIAEISARGSVLGELAVLLDQCHTADVRTLEASEFDVANGPTLLADDSAVALYVATILARRLDCANRAIIGLKRQLQAGESPCAIGQTVEKVEQLLNSGEGASLVYAGYPYDPFTPGQSMH